MTKRLRDLLVDLGLPSARLLRIPPRLIVNIEWKLLEELKDRD